MEKIGLSQSVKLTKDQPVLHGIGRYLAQIIPAVPNAAAEHLCGESLRDAKMSFTPRQVRQGPQEIEACDAVA